MHACVWVPEAMTIHQTRTHSQGITIFHYRIAAKLRETYFRDSVLQVCYFLLFPVGLKWMKMCNQLQGGRGNLCQLADTNT